MEQINLLAALYREPVIEELFACKPVQQNSTLSWPKLLLSEPNTQYNLFLVGVSVLQRSHSSNLQNKLNDLTKSYQFNQHIYNQKNSTKHQQMKITQHQTIYTIPSGCNYCFGTSRFSPSNPRSTASSSSHFALLLQTLVLPRLHHTSPHFTQLLRRHPYPLPNPSTSNQHHSTPLYSTWHIKKQRTTPTSTSIKRQ
ncbi:hypothetical protein KC19_VG275100 [Ceratodon purpureus]|uniref:Uncharacterized protein n=1 Tax=Ceratodon purpureus TaxID=3225 RepID=A0A8T0HUS1_CERPU|nr:hypothetical protein KC19_VG275100 [Ceratodon purpureus]